MVGKCTWLVDLGRETAYKREEEPQGRRDDTLSSYAARPLRFCFSCIKKRPWKSMSVFGIRPMINVWRTGLLFLLS